MSRCCAVGLVLLLGAGCVPAQQSVRTLARDVGQPTTMLTHILDVKALSTADAAKAVPVRLTGVVTTLSGWKNSFFLQSGDYAISVDRSDTTAVQSGDEVEVVGVSAAGMFAPVVAANQVTVLKRGTLRKADLPKAKRVDYGDLATGRLDSSWVQVDGIVRSEAVSEIWGREVLFLMLRVGASNLPLLVLNYEKKDPGLVDAKVTVEGACGAVFNDRRQLTGVRLFVPSLGNVHVEEAPRVDRFAMEPTSLDELFRYGSAKSSEHEIKVAGVVSYQDRPNKRLYLQGKSGGIVVNTAQTTFLEPGDRVEAVGFLSGAQFSITLDDAVFRKVGHEEPPTAVEVNPAQMIQDKDGFRFAPFDGLLVRANGSLVEKIKQGPQETWVIRNGGQVYNAVFAPGDDVAEFERIHIGSKLQLTGVVRTEVNQRGEPQGFVLVVRESEDVAVLGTPWWDAQRSVWLVGMLVGACFVMLIWGLQTRRALRDLSPRHAASSREIIRRCRIFARAAGIAVAVVAAAALLAWLFDFEILRRPGGAILYPNAALSLLFAGCALTLTERLRRRGGVLRNFLALAAGLIGLLTLLEYSLRVDLHIDELMFRDEVSEVHGRMAVATAINLVLLSIALLLAERKKSTTASQLLTGVAGLLCVLASLADLYSVPTLFSFGAQNGMAVPAMFSCMILCGGILALQADRGLMAVVTSDGPGGVIARMLLPVALLMPAALGWTQWKGQFSYELYSSSEGLALFTASLIVVFVSIILIGAALLNRSDLERVRMEFEASHDGLTRLLNRTGIMEMLRVELIRSGRERKPISVILADVDHFKSVNDELGHQAGDEVLKEVARRLKLSLRDYDGVGRFGGEEFLMVLPACELNAAVSRAELICAAMSSEPIVLPDQTRSVTLSLGVSVVEPTSPNRQESLIQAADVALYEAKNGGRNQVRAMVPKPLPELAGVV